MGSDEQSKENEPDRKHLLEEIRRRAEEAELKRLEDEEQGTKASAPKAEGELKSEDQIPFPIPSQEPTLPPPVQTARDQKIALMRERIIIALDRGKVEKAGEILSELRNLIPDDPGLLEFKEKIVALQEEKLRAREKKRIPEAKPRVTSAKEREQKENAQKRIDELVDNANSYYQQEKYEKGMECVDQALALDPTNAEALRLREQIVKAQQIAELIRREETRRKAEDAASLSTVPHAEVQQKFSDDKDVWGTSTPAHSEAEYDLPPEEKGPVGPPKPPLVDRVVTRLAAVRIPLRPVVTAGAIVAIGLIGYIVAENVRNAVSPPRFSILILPSATNSVDSTTMYIADGFTEGLITDLSGVAEVRAIGAPSSLSLKGSTVAPARLARNLGANFYMTWSLSRTGEAFLLQSSLFDSVTAKPVWTLRTAASYRELPWTRLELARKVLAGMGVTPGGDEDLALRKVPTSSVAAYDAYLRGRSMLRQPDQYAPSEAVAVFAQAAEADSVFVDAQSALGWAYVLAYEMEKEAPLFYVQMASGCVQRAILLGSRSAETFRVWGMVEQIRLQYDKAVERFEAAIKVAPSDAESQRRLAALYVAKGQYEAALKAAQRAVADDPGNILSFTRLGQVQQFLGQYIYVAVNEAEESRVALIGALRSYEQGMRLARDRNEYGSGAYADVQLYLQQPDRAIELLNDKVARYRESYIDYYKLGRAGQSAGKPKQEWQDAFLKAKTILQASLGNDSEDALAHSYLALVLTRLGEFKEAIAEIKRAQQIAPNDVDVLYNTARMYTLHRDKSQALEYLGKAINRQYGLARVLDMDFYNLRSEEEFIKAITR